MTKPNNSSIVHALRLARNRIRRYRNGYICAELEVLAIDRKVSYDTVDYIQKLIMKRLGKAKTYSGWVRDKHPEVESMEYWRGRVQWIDALIVEHGGTP